MKRRITLTALVSSLAVLLTVLLSGCGTVVPQADAAALGESRYPTLSSDVANTVSSDIEQRSANANQPTYITLEEAKAIALNHAGVSAADTRWDDREYDLENGRSLYELEFSANGVEYEYDIDATDGKILLSRAERDDDRPVSSTTNTSKPSTPAYIGLEKAKAAALKKAGVSASAVRWEKAELDFDDGCPVYELEFCTGSTEYDCDVHAESGKILDYEADCHDDDDDDHDDDDHHGGHHDHD